MAMAEGVPFFESKNESFRYVGPGAISNDSEFCFQASCRYGPWNVSLGSRVGIRSTWLRKYQYRTGSLPSRLQIIFGQQYHFVVEDHTTASNDIDTTALQPRRES